MARAQDCAIASKVRARGLSYPKTKDLTPTAWHTAYPKIKDLTPILKTHWHTDVQIIFVGWFLSKMLILPWYMQHFSNMIKINIAGKWLFNTLLPNGTNTCVTNNQLRAVRWMIIGSQNVKTSVPQWHTGLKNSLVRCAVGENWKQVWSKAMAKLQRKSVEYAFRVRNLQTTVVQNNAI